MFQAMHNCAVVPGIYKNNSRPRLADEKAASEYGLILKHDSATFADERDILSQCPYCGAKVKCSMIAAKE